MLPGRCRVTGPHGMGGGLEPAARTWPASTSLFMPQLPLPLLLNEQKLLGPVYPIRAPTACVSHIPATALWTRLPETHGLTRRGQDTSICSEHRVKNTSKPGATVIQQNPRVTHQQSPSAVTPLPPYSFLNSPTGSSPGGRSVLGTMQGGAQQEGAVVTACSCGRPGGEPGPGVAPHVAGLWGAPSQVWPPHAPPGGASLTRSLCLAAVTRLSSVTWPSCPSDVVCSWPCSAHGVDVPQRGGPTAGTVSNLGRLGCAAVSNPVNVFRGT